MEYKILGKKNLTPVALKTMTNEERAQLCAELRDKILNTVSSNGGHLASNLGVIELTVSLLSVFDYTRDKIVFDVGHQSYAYKILTGRFEEFDTLRQKGGISGFPRISESEYDRFDTGHSSTSISAALGMARARDLKKEDNYIVSVVGDGALTGGLAYEAINDAGHSKTRMLIILNDNEMSIDRNVGGLSKYLSKLRYSSGYISAKATTESFLRKLGFFGRGLIRIIIALKDFFRFLIYRKKPSIFEDLGLVYYGPVDGHDVKSMIKAMDAVKDVKAPVLLHVVTKKGKGYGLAERNPSDYHGVGPFDLTTGVTGGSKPSYTTAFGGAICEIASQNRNVIAISAAMTQGTGLENYSLKFPTRFFDCGIAEEHCVTMAGGLAVSGFVPVVAVYSSFLQRAYDEMISDVCFMNSHVVFAIDRAGFVGNDGHTHNGLLDISYMNTMVNMTVLSPRDYKDLRHCLDYAVNKCEGPVAVRYPRGSSPFELAGPLYTEPEECVLPHMSYGSGNDFAIISTGRIASEADRAVELLKEKGINGIHINLAMIKPIPFKELIRMTNGIRNVFTLEEGILSGGFGEACARGFCENKCSCHVYNIAVANPMIRAASPSEQIREAGIDAVSVAERISSVLGGV